ncbi:MAG TPA: polysaccharide deacetylase family protein [Solirubrobacteraceae bacterium]|nr:polysaccharide deacetylase family protein [Solirubrobacteraceae bacterium]
MDVEARRRRREALRLARRRRRRTAAALVGLGAFAAVVAVILSAGGTGRSGANGHRSAGRSQAGGRRARARGAALARRNGGGVDTGHPGAAAVPILMYHVIAAPPAGAPFPGLYVPPAEFAEQMNALARAGWTAVTPDELDAYWRRGISLPRGRPIVLSFDNGYQSQYMQALPVLRRLGWVGEENIQLTGLPPSQGGLSEDEVRGMIAAGWELDTQGISHADLITLSASALREQVAGARRTIQRRFHVPVNWFCYPSGHYDASVIGQVKAAGYKGSTTVVPGWAHPNEDRYRLHRLRVLGGTSGQALLSLLAATRGDPPAPTSYNGS